MACNVLWPQNTVSHLISWLAPRAAETHATLFVWLIETRLFCVEPEMSLLSLKTKLKQYCKTKEAIKRLTPAPLKWHLNKHFMVFERRNFQKLLNEHDKYHNRRGHFMRASPKMFKEGVGPQRQQHRQLSIYGRNM